jgi:hypothetical protein
MKRPSKVKVHATTAWAEISEDHQPEIWNVAWYRENLRQDLRHIRVRIVPVHQKVKRPPAEDRRQG